MKTQIDLVREGAINLYSRAFNACPEIRSAPSDLINDMALSQLFLLRQGVADMTLVPHDERDNIFAFIYGTWRWACYGAPIFSLTESAAARFALTDLRGVSVAESCIPFRALMLTTPPEMITFTHPDTMSRVETEYVLAFLARRPKTKDDGIRLRDVVFLRHSPRAPGPYESAEHLHIVLGAKGINCWGHCVVSDTDSLEQVIARMISFDPLPITSLSSPLNAIDKEAIQSATRIVFNACLYAAHVRNDRLRVAAKHYLSLRTQALGLPDVATWIIGKSINIDPESLEAAKAMSCPGRSGWRVRSKFIVRGHWRNQSFGPRHGQRRMMWIQPFWKGPTDAKEAILRMYRESTALTQ